MKSKLAIMALGQPGGALDDEINKSGELQKMLICRNNLLNPIYIAYCGKERVYSQEVSFYVPKASPLKV